MDGNQVLGIWAEVFENGFEADHFRGKRCIGLDPFSDVIRVRDTEGEQLSFVFFNTGGCVVRKKPWHAISKSSRVP